MVAFFIVDYKRKKGKRSVAQMIPKILHYCWFGGRPKSDIFLRCLESWKQFAPDFELKEWNEMNSVPYHNKFYHDAMRKGKYAFAADCIRVQVLYNMGGIYLDTDMLIIKPIESLLSYAFFTGYEVEGRANFAIFGAIKKNHVLKNMKEFYDVQYFNPFSPPVITHTFKELVVKEQLKHGEVILPIDYFYPLPYQKRDEHFQEYITPATLAVHLWEHSWKAHKKEGFWQLLKKLNEVCIDYMFYGYPKAHFKRYSKEFSRKLYHKLIGKKV